MPAFEVLRFETSLEFTQTVAELGPHLREYRAVVTVNHAQAREVQLTEPRVPIVFEAMASPLQNCLVDSLTRPGRNATGYLHHVEGSSLQMLDLLLRAFPSVQEVAIPVSHRNVSVAGCAPVPLKDAEQEACRPGLISSGPYLERRLDGRQEVQALLEGARERGVGVRFIAVCSGEDLEPQVQATAKAMKSGAWLVPFHALFDQHRPALLRAMQLTGQPAIYNGHRWSRAGGLMSLQVHSEQGTDSYQWLAFLRVLQGESPAELPVMLPRGFTLQVNLRTAREQGLRPQTALLRVADTLLH